MIERLSLTEIKREIYHALGVEDATASTMPWNTEANLTTKVNLIGQRIPQLLANVLAGEGVTIADGLAWPDMWRTRTTISISASDTTFNYPENFGKQILLRDTTNSRQLRMVRPNPTYRFQKLMDKPSGLSQYVSLRGISPDAADSNIQKYVGVLHPAAASAFTLTLDYYRIPAVMPDSDPDNEYPDAHPQFHYLWVSLPVLEAMRPMDPGYDRMMDHTNRLLRELAASVEV